MTVTVMKTTKQVSGGWLCRDLLGNSGGTSMRYLCKSSDLRHARQDEKNLLAQ